MKMANLETARSLESGRRTYRLVFSLLAVLPFAPEIAIWIIIALARMTGCQLDQTQDCLLGPVSAGRAIGLVLQGTAGFIVAHADSTKFGIGLFATIAGWQTACYWALNQGWTGIWSRLSLGFVVALLFTIMPYFGLTMATSSLASKTCPPAEQGRACQVFGNYVGAADYNPMLDAGQLGWLVLIGAPLALGIFVAYSIWVVIAGIRSAKRIGEPA